MKPQRFSSSAQVEAISTDLGGLLEPVASAYLPYLLANQKAVIAGRNEVNYEALGVTWKEPAIYDSWGRVTE